MKRTSVWWRYKIYSICLITLLVNHSCQWRPFKKLPEISHKKISLSCHLSTHRLSVRNRIVDIHNHFRANVKPPAKDMLKMRWDKRAAKDTKRWARSCRILQHDSPSGRWVEDFGSCGQNIFISTHKVPWLYAIRSWWSEKKVFTYGAKPKNAVNNLTAVGHYTQMAWAATHRIGCSINKCYLPSKVKSNEGMSNGTTYYTYICNYCPIGNFMERLGYPYKVGQQCEACSNSCEEATNRPSTMLKKHRIGASIIETFGKYNASKRRIRVSRKMMKMLLKKLSFNRRAQIKRIRRKEHRKRSNAYEKRIKKEYENTHKIDGERRSKQTLLRKLNRMLKRKKYSMPITNINIHNQKKGRRRRRRTRKLCTNGCNFADMWMNCKQLSSQWRDWLCNSRESSEGIERFGNCKATCTCDAKSTIKN